LPTKVFIPEKCTKSLLLVFFFFTITVSFFIDKNGFPKILINSIFLTAALTTKFSSKFSASNKVNLEDKWTEVRKPKKGKEIVSILVALGTKGSSQLLEWANYDLPGLGRAFSSSFIMGEVTVGLDRKKIELGWNKFYESSENEKVKL
jgi:hypothetical protein